MANEERWGSFESRTDQSHFNPNSLASTISGMPTGSENGTNKSTSNALNSSSSAPKGMYTAGGHSLEGATASTSPRPTPSEASPNQGQLHATPDSSTPSTTHPYIRPHASGLASNFFPSHARSGNLSSPSFDHQAAFLANSYTSDVIHAPFSSGPSAAPFLASTLNHQYSALLPTSSSDYTSGNNFHTPSHNTAPSSSGQSGIGNLSATFHTPHPPFPPPIFPYASHAHLAQHANSSGNWAKFEEPGGSNDFSFQHRAHRAKPVPPSDEPFQFPQYTSSFMLPPSDATSTNFHVADARNSPEALADGSRSLSSPSSLQSSTTDVKLATSSTSTRKPHHAGPKTDDDSNEPIPASIPTTRNKRARQTASTTKKRRNSVMALDSDQNDGEINEPSSPTDNGPVFQLENVHTHLDLSPATMAAKSAIKLSFESSHIQIRGERKPILNLARSGRLITLEQQPTEHQVKDFNIIPMPVIRLSADASSKLCDFVAAFLYCDENMNIADPIFLAALNAKLVNNHELPFVNLRVTKEMLKGRTKGFSFVIGFTYMSNGQEIETIYSSPFWLFSNVNQEGFPKSERDSYLRPQWRDASSSFSAKRKR